MKKIGNVLFIPVVVSFLFFSFSMALAGEIINSAIGGGIGSALSNVSTSNKDLGIMKEENPQFQSELIPQANIEASQLVGIYVLDSFIVYFDSGLTIDSKYYQFTGDMAITSNNTMWQRFDVSGFPIIVGSGRILISGNTFTIYNDLVAYTSVGSSSWDGTYLRTELRNTSVSDPFTEIDVWKRILSSFDQDEDGVIDEWDECPDTSAPCVNNKGCRCTTINPAIPSLLLND